MGAAFDAGKAGTAGERRVQSTAKLRDPLTRALAAIHAVLSPEQRERLAYLIRTGVLACKLSVAERHRHDALSAVWINDQPLR